MPAVTMRMRPGKRAPRGLFEKAGSLFIAEVVIQQHHVGRFAVERLESFGGRGAGRNHAEIRFSFEQPAQALAEQTVIVHEKDPDGLA